MTTTIVTRDVSQPPRDGVSATTTAGATGAGYVLLRALRVAAAQWRVTGNLADACTADELADAIELRGAGHVGRTVCSTFRCRCRECLSAEVLP